MLKKLITGALTAAVAITASINAAQAEDELFIPMLSYRTGPFAGAEFPLQTGFTIT